MALIRSSLFTLAMLLLAACQSRAGPVVEASTTQTECKEPRATVCEEKSAPVCAVRDTGIRCVTVPCPSTQRLTYASACAACADPKVSAYSLGACRE